jgi:hypothetical protein
MNISWLLIGVALLPSSVFGQYGDMPIAMYLQHARVFSGPEANALGHHALPAAIPRTKNQSVGVMAATPFLLSEIKQILFAASLPLPQSGIGGSFSYFGNSHFKKFGVALAYARQFATVAASTRFIAERVETNSEKLTSAGAEISLLLQLNSDVQASLQIHRRVLMNGNLKQNRPEYLFAFGYRPSDELALSVIVRSALLRQPEMFPTISYTHDRVWFVQASYATGTSQYVIVCGFHIKDLLLTASTAFHFALGFSPCISIAFQKHSDK